MANVHRSGSWSAITETVRGASHINSGLPNQDAIDVGRSPGTRLIVAIADGHGSTRYIRSDVGAKLAVAVAIEELTPLLKHHPRHVISASELEERFAQILVRKWRDKVSAHLSEYPLIPEERGKSGTAFEDDYLCYGTTLLTVVVTKSLLLYLQLGDGDILVVEKSGGIVRPLPKDEALIGNETTSLCSPEAWNKVRISTKVLARDNHDEHPALILVATDGYANCFRDEAAFLQAAKDYCELLNTSNGVDAIKQNLHQWLCEASEKYSGDDITVALLSQSNHCRKPTHVQKRAR